MFRLACFCCLALLFAACGAPRPAKLSPSQLIRAAQSARANGELAAAANYYRRAYEARPRDVESLFQAAELYARLRDYAAAAEAYEKLPPDDEKWPLLGLKLGRNLVQSGRPQAAREAFTRFQTNYNGADRAYVLELARTQVRGLDLRASQADRPAVATISRPGAAINSSAGEFGASTPAADLLFFSGTAGGQSRLYQSRKRGAVWSKAAVPEGFPVITTGEFGTGSLSADGKHFFFSICSGLPGEDPQNRCDIFYAPRRGPGAWGQPRQLGHTVNDPAANNAYPFIHADEDGFTLFFASNRAGGLGGTDLYVATAAPANPTEFTAARPLGGGLNTVGNETTPFYDPAGGGTLYFASDGHPGWGGLDVFRARRDGPISSEPTSLPGSPLPPVSVLPGEPGGAAANWRFARPEHAGGPLNSPADDYGLSLLPAGQGGFLTSNRLGFGRETTVETDLFAFEFLSYEPRLEAAVFDAASGEELVDYTVFLRAADGREITRRTFPTPTYSLPLRTAGRYRVTICKTGYETASYNVVVQPGGYSIYGLPTNLRLSPPGAQARECGEAKPESASGGGRVDPADDSRSPGRSARSPEQLPAPGSPPPAPAAVGTLFRVQVAAVRKFQPGAARYAPLQSFGTVRPEAIPGRPTVRVLVGDFATEKEARRALAEIRRAGFPDAYLVRYDDGIRQ